LKEGKNVESLINQDLNVSLQNRSIKVIRKNSQKINEKRKKEKPFLEPK
jgi:hypothetical protein